MELCIKNINLESFSVMVLSFEQILLTVKCSRRFEYVSDEPNKLMRRYFYDGLLSLINIDVLYLETRTNSKSILRFMSL